MKVEGMPDFEVMMAEEKYNLTAITSDILAAADLLHYKFGGLPRLIEVLAS